MSNQHSEWVNTYLQEKGWDFSRERDDIFKCGVKLDEDNEDSWISGTYVVQEDYCVFIATPRFEVPKNKINEVSRLFTVINKKLFRSTLILDVSCGWIGCRTGMLFDEDKTIPAKVFEKMILSTCEVMVDTATAIRKVAMGEWTADQAVKKLEMD